MSSAPDCDSDCGCHGNGDGRVWFGNLRVIARVVYFRLARIWNRWNAPLDWPR